MGPNPPPVGLVGLIGLVASILADLIEGKDWSLVLVLMQNSGMEMRPMNYEKNASSWTLGLWGAVTECGVARGLLARVDDRPLLVCFFVMEAGKYKNSSSWSFCLRLRLTTMSVAQLSVFDTVQC